MSGSGYNWIPPPESWPSRRSYGDRVPNRHLALSRLLTLRSPPGTSEAAQVSRWWFEERVVTGPLGATRFPHPQPSIQFLVLDSPPPFTNQWNMQLPTQQEDDSTLSKEEQKRALSKLKKEIYNPSLKNLSKRLCLYYRDNNARNSYSNSNKARNETDNDGKRCAVCLEDFEAREEVTLTPCNHMFHDDCIVPWVRGHGQCPVCRLVV